MPPILDPALFVSFAGIFFPQRTTALPAILFASALISPPQRGLPCPSQLPIKIKACHHFPSPCIIFPLAFIIYLPFSHNYLLLFVLPIWVRYHEVSDYLCAEFPAFKFSLAHGRSSMVLNECMHFTKYITKDNLYGIITGIWIIAKVSMVL